MGVEDKLLLLPRIRGDVDVDAEEDVSDGDDACTWTWTWRRRWRWRWRWPATGGTSLENWNVMILRASWGCVTRVQWVCHKQTLFSM